MARYRDYDDRYDEAYEDEHYRQRPIRRRPRHSPIEIIAYLITFGILGLTLFLGWPLLSVHIGGQLAGALARPTARAYPTADASALQRDQESAPATAAEEQAVEQAIPTADTNVPPPLPAQATAAVIDQPVMSSDETRQYSPADLGWAPVPTPTTMLSQEQFDAAQASEEQNQLNTAQSGLTEAQKLVQVHEAEQNAQAQP